MDEQEKLHLFLRTSLREVTRQNRSLMPAANLTAAELENVIAFLKKTERSDIGQSAWTPSPDLNVSFQRIRNAREEPQNWLTYWGVPGHPLQPSEVHYARQREVAREPVVLPIRRHQCREHAHRGRWRNVRHWSVEQCRGTGRAHGTSYLALYAPPAQRPCAMHGHDQSRIRDSRRPALHGHARRAFGRIGCQNRQRDLGHNRRRLPCDSGHFALCAVLKVLDFNL